MAPEQHVEDIGRLRARGDEASIKAATKIEKDFEEGLAKNASGEELEARGYDPEGLRKAHRQGTRNRSRASVPDSSAQLSGDRTRDQLETLARNAGVEGDPSDRDAYPNKAALIDAIEKKEG